MAPGPVKPTAVMMSTATEKEKTGKKDTPAIGGFISNDGFLWTDTNPDMKLIEPRILVTVNFNYLEFPRKVESMFNLAAYLIHFQADRPPECRKVCLVNHGDYPVAFQVHTTDNYSYFVDRRSGVIPPRQTSVNAVVRMANVAVINVYHRPHNEYNEEDRAAFYNVPHKDKMFIHLAPQMCQTFSPEAIFHNERCYEKLRVMLRYSGIELKPDDKRPKQLLLNAAPGWATWKNEEQRKHKNHAKQIAAFRKMEKTINENASKEQVVDEPKKAMVIPRRTKRTPIRMRTPTKTGVLKTMLKHLNPFSKDKDEMKPQSKPVTPTVVTAETPPQPSPGRTPQKVKHVEAMSPNTKDKDESGTNKPKITSFEDQRQKKEKAPDGLSVAANRMSKMTNIEVPTPRKAKDMKDKSIETPIPGAETGAPEAMTPRKSKEKKDKTNELPSVTPGIGRKTKPSSTETPTRDQKDKTNELPSLTPVLGRKLKPSSTEAPTKEQHGKFGETPSMVVQKKTKTPLIDAMSPGDLRKTREQKDKNLEGPSPAIIPKKVKSPSPPRIKTTVEKSSSETQANTQTAATREGSK